MIKTLTNLGYSEWTSISDSEVRTGSPRVYCTFLRFLLDAHPRVLQVLLSPPTSSTSNTAAASCSEGFGIYSPQFNNQPLQRSSINKYVATTLGFRAPSPSCGGGSSRHCGNENHHQPHQQQNSKFASSNNSTGSNSNGFIVEMDDSKFMQRLLQHVLPEHFAVAAPMTPFQFFRSTGGFVLQKAKLVRNVAALFARREQQLQQGEQSRADAVAHTRLLMDRRRREHMMRQCGVGESLAYLEFEPRPLVDESRHSNNVGGGIYANLTARQKVELAEKQRQSEIARRLDAIKVEQKQLEQIANKARKIISSRNDSNDDNEERVSQTGPLTLLASPERKGSSHYVVVNKELEELRRRDEELLHKAATERLLLDQARSRNIRPENQELIEENVMLVSPARRK